jgi:hypothetical protein
MISPLFVLSLILCRPFERKTALNSSVHFDETFWEKHFKQENGFAQEVRERGGIAELTANGILAKRSAGPYGFSP